MKPAIFTSRPLRAVGAVLASWILIRTGLVWGSAPVAASVDPQPVLWPPTPAGEGRYDPVATAALPAAPPAAPPIAPLAASSPGAAIQIAHRAPLRLSVHRMQIAGAVPRPAAISQTTVPGEPGTGKLGTGLPGMDMPGPSANTASIGPTALPVRGPHPVQNRFQIAGWALVRDGSAPNAVAPGGVLGGSQVGARAWFAPGNTGLAVTARVSASLGNRASSEAAVGFGYRKGAFGVIAEERFALDRKGGARPSVTAFGGVSDVRLPGRLRLDGYAQAGFVGLKSPVGFIDGAVRIERPLAGRTVRLSVGAGAWGGAQPGRARFDIGPQIVARLPALGGTVRIAGEWRIRAAGNADPGSGPALSIGIDL
jgi:hypothetical protein